MSANVRLEGKIITAPGPTIETSPKGDAMMDFPIVGIGASAGGLEALEALFAHMPPDTGMAFVDHPASQPETQEPDGRNPSEGNAYEGHPD